MKNFDVIVIGAGAAGLMCAIEAGKRGRRVLVLEKTNRVGKKILMSGGGRCNFTNLYTSPENYISHNPHFCKSALSRYTPWHFIHLVESHKIPYYEKKLGQLFCQNKSSDIVEMLLEECEKAKVEIKLEQSIQDIVKKENSFQIDNKYACESLVMATGGLSIPTLGSSPFGLKIAEQFNLNIYPTKAGLVPVTLHPNDKECFADLSGISLDAIVTVNGIEFRENILFTHRGLSGPSILQISSYWSPGEEIAINLLPELHLTDAIYEAISATPDIHLKTFLYQHFPKKFIHMFLNEELLDKSIKSLQTKDIDNLVTKFMNWKIKPNATEGYRTAEVTLGGVDCNELSSQTFEVKSVQGLYFIGELLDVTGWLGGYNFQWAWASGWAAGQVV
jgi:hypothetical protein